MINKAMVDAKLLHAAPNILAHNRSMVEVMLRNIKPMVIAQTPLGPGHFGYHLRDRYVSVIFSRGVRTVGLLKSPWQGYWREYGTKRGERAFMTAHIALQVTRRIIRVYYGGMTAWWRIGPLKK